MCKTLKTLFVFAFVSMLIVGCSAHAACDAYSYINNQKDNSQQQHIVKQHATTSQVG